MNIVCKSSQAFPCVVERLHVEDLLTQALYWIMVSLGMEKMRCEGKYSLIITNVCTLFKVGSLTINKIANLPVTVR